MTAKPTFRTSSQTFGVSAALLSSVPAAMVALRILFEERFLRRELKDYEAYTEKVRYRLIPFLW